MPRADYDSSAQVLHNWVDVESLTDSLELSIDNHILLQVDPSGLLQAIEVIGGPKGWRIGSEPITMPEPNNTGGLRFDIRGIAGYEQFDDQVTVLTTPSKQQLIAFLSPDYGTASCFRIGENTCAFVDNGVLKAFLIADLAP